MSNENNNNNENIEQQTQNKSLRKKLLDLNPTYKLTTLSEFYKKWKLLIWIIFIILLVNYNNLYFWRFNKKILPLGFQAKHMILLKDETVLIITQNLNKDQSITFFHYNPKANTLIKSISLDNFDMKKLCYYLKDNGDILFFTNTRNTEAQKYFVKEYNLLKNSFSIVDEIPKMGSMHQSLVITVSQLNKKTLFVIANENRHYFFDLEKNKFIETSKNPFSIRCPQEAVNIGNDKILVTASIKKNNKEYEFFTYDAKNKIFTPFLETEELKRANYHLLKINDNEILLYYPVYIWHPMETSEEYKKNLKKYDINKKKIIDAGQLKQVHQHQYGILLPDNKILFFGFPYKYMMLPPFGPIKTKQNDGCEIYDINTMKSVKCKYCPNNLATKPVVLKNGEIIAISSFRTGKGYQVIQKFHYSKLK